MNPTCERYEATLSAWLDGERDPAGSIELLDHFARCAGCRTFYLEARALDGLVAGIGTAPASATPDPELWERIRSTARSKRRPVRGRIAGIPAWALRAAALLVLAAGLAFVAFRGDAPDGAEAPRIEVLAEGSASEMSEQRFVELASEVLRSDRRYQRAMYQVMEQVLGDDAGESSPNEILPRDEGDEAPAEAGETRQPGRA